MHSFDKASVFVHGMIPKMYIITSSKTFTAAFFSQSRYVRVLLSQKCIRV